MNTKSFDTRTFEYGGHVSYSFTTLGGTRTLNILTHNNSNCGSGQCGTDPHFLVKCRITAGNTTYNHDLIAKILKNGVEVDSKTVDCFHINGNWQYAVGYFPFPPYVGDLDDNWTFRVSIRDQNFTQQTRTT